MPTAAGAFRRFLALFALLWALGLVGFAIRRSGAVEQADLGRLLFDCGLGLPLVAVAVGLAIAAVRFATALALPAPVLWAAAWVPCLSVVALVAFAWMLRTRLAEKGLAFRLAFASAPELQSYLGE